MNAQERVAELTQKMLQRTLYAIFGKTVVPAEQLMPLLPGWFTEGFELLDTLGG